MRDDWLKPRNAPEELPQSIRKFKTPRMVQVDWIDSTGWTGWRNSRDWTDRASNRCRSVGFLLSEDKEAIHLAASADCEGSFNDRQSIPKGCIKAIQQLEVKDAHKKSPS